MCNIYARDVNDISPFDPLTNLVVFVFVTSLLELVDVVETSGVPVLVKPNLSFLFPWKNKIGVSSICIMCAQLYNTHTHVQ